MDAAPSPWGVTASPAAPVKLHDVMDEELAAKLQREEEEQWEREIATRFGDEKKVGWCFVEVPSADCEYGVMSVIEQEIAMEEEANVEDPDYALALELQAQEADEYDRLRRQEVSSMERIQVIQQEHPKRRQLCDFMGSSSAAARSKRGAAHAQTKGLKPQSQAHSHPPAPAAQSQSRGRSSVPLPLTAGLSFRVDEDHLHASVDSVYQDDHEEDAPRAERATFDDDDDDEQDDDDFYLEDDCGLPIRKFNSLHLSLRSIDPKHRVSVASQY